MRIDTLERTIRRLERQHRQGLTREIQTWEQQDDGTYINAITGEQVAALPERPGLLNVVVQLVTADEASQDD